MLRTLHTDPTASLTPSLYLATVWNGTPQAASPWERPAATGQEGPALGAASSSLVAARRRVAAAAPPPEQELTRASVPPAAFRGGQQSPRRMKLLEGLISHHDSSIGNGIESILPPLPKPGDPLDALDEEVLAIALKDQALALNLAARRHTGLHALVGVPNGRDATHMRRPEAKGSVRFADDKINLRYERSALRFPFRLARSFRRSTNRRPTKVRQPNAL